MANTSTTKRSNVAFASIDSYIESNMVLPTESVTKKNLVEWGEGNCYPDYLLSLYNSVPTLRSIIKGNVDYITGDDVTLDQIHEGLEKDVVNKKGETIRDQVKEIAKNFEIYGGYALQIIRDLTGRVCEIYALDMRYLRTNKNCDVFYYSEEWNKKFSKKDALVYPAFMKNLKWETLDEESRKRHLVSILFVKDINTQVYPSPLYSASVKACEIERMIDDFHINSLQNQFVSSAIINFNNGIPSDEIKSEIEEEVNEKFSGSSNAGRIMLSWNPNKQNQTDIVEFKVDDFGARYESLSKHSRQQIFTAFRANPNLFGIPTEGNGFSNEEYSESFQLYNRTQILPIQRLIAETYEKILGRKDVLHIVPFSVNTI